jgi:hypothetical protein
MPRNIVPRGAAWNFGAGSLWTHRGWQYAAYWDDRKQVSVARRELPTGDWEVVSLPGYQRKATGDRGKGGAISRGFGDGHEKVAMGISPDGAIHLSFDHHLSTLRYRVSKPGVANDPASHPWRAGLFEPVQNHLGGGKIVSVTYPSFHTDGNCFLLYLRLDGGAGSASSNLFSYEGGRWIVNSEKGSKIIDKRWSGGNGTVNAYPFGMILENGRCHLTWCWRDTPKSNTCHDLCYAYSDDHGATWRNNAGEVIAKRGEKAMTADSPGISVWPIPAGGRYINGGSMTVDDRGRVHVLVRGEDGRPAHFTRDPETARWVRREAPDRGSLVQFPEAVGEQFVVSDGVLYRVLEGETHGKPIKWERLEAASRDLFKDCKPGRDFRRAAHDGWVSLIGQQGKRVRVVDFRLPR